MTIAIPDPRIGAAPRVNIHASAVVLGEAAAPFGGVPDVAVLLLGPSGAGKSDVALRLIAMGAKLLADDQTAIFIENGRLFAECPPSLHGQIEMHGVGIVTMETAEPARVALVVVLDPEGRIERLPEPASYRPPDPLKPVIPPPVLTLRPFEASTPAKILASAAALSRGGFVAGAGITP
jgi:HPr kinase/phosphorylase